MTGAKQSAGTAHKMPTATCWSAAVPRPSPAA